MERGSPSNPELLVLDRRALLCGLHNPCLTKSSLCSPLTHPSCDRSPLAGKHRPSFLKLDTTSPHLMCIIKADLAFFIQKKAKDRIISS